MEQVAQMIQSSTMTLEENDLILVGMERKQSGDHHNPYQLESLLGKLRVSLYSLGQENHLIPSFELISPSAPLTFLWVKNFPLFEYDKNGAIKSCHHPFTAPSTIFDKKGMEQCGDVMKCESSSCDLVLNGNEVGGGYVIVRIIISSSLRIHNYDLQLYIMKQILGIENTDIVISSICL